MIRLMDANVFHARLRPRLNKFAYHALYMILPVGALSAPRRQGLFSIGGFNLFSVRPADYAGNNGTPAQRISEILNDWGLECADGAVWLMTMPRIFGYAFNPVSFWLCFDREEKLRAVLAEVNNTFGEKHCYLSFHDDHRAIAPSDTLAAKKVFHVSPFLKVAGDYSFRFAVAAERIDIAINLSDEDGAMLRTSVAGRLTPLRSVSLLRFLLRNPLYPVKIIGLIHYQAVKLFLKGIKHFHKPAPPVEMISR